MRSSLTNNFSRSDSSTPIENEIEALSSIYPEQLEKCSGKPNYEIRIFLKPNPLTNQQGKDPICWIKLLVKFNEGYPRIPPELEIYEKYNITRKELDRLNEGIDDIVMSKSSENSEMIYDICRFLENFLDDKSKAYEPQMKPTSPKEFGKPSKLCKLSPVVLNKDNNKYFKKLNNRKLSLNEKSRTISEMNNEMTKEDVKYMRNFMKDDNFQDSDYKQKHSHFMSGFENDQNNLKIQASGSKSRLESDFEMIAKIGQGGGGRVYKVRHNIDKQLYAIKKIKLFTKKNPEKILKEVMLLSRLQHPNIVRYYQAWYEDYETKEEESDEDEFEVNSEEEDEGTDSKINEDESDMIQRGDSRFTDNSYKDLENKNPKNNKQKTQSDNSETLLVFEEPQTNVLKNNVWEVEDDTSYCRSLKRQKNSNTKYLIIQMEYCEGQTLREAIDKKDIQEEKTKWKIIIQIIDALSYIHKKGLIHRDIKPANIFLDKKNNVKLGDFGLATVTKPKTAIENLNMMSKKEFIKFEGGDLLSCGIGTLYYCSPEQEKNNKYDEKTDMFSLGIVLFEMFFTFNSLMERDIVLRNIKDNHKFPPKLETSAPADAVDIIKKLTIKDPNLRPSSHELLNSTLVSRNYNEKTVLDNLNKMIEENNPFYLKVVDVVFKNKLLNLENENELASNFDLSSSKFSGLNVNNNYECSLDNYFSKLNSLGQTNNIRTFNFILSTYNKICEDLRKLFRRENAKLLRFSELEAFNTRNYVYDSVKDSIVSFELNKTNGNIFSLEEENAFTNNLMLTKSGDLVRTTNNIYSQIKKFIIQQFCNSPIPIKIHTDSLSFKLNHSSNRIDESAELDYNLIWIGSDSNLLSNSFNITTFRIIPENDETYQQNCVELLLNSIETFDFYNNIQIVVNSSVIIDYFFQRIGSSYDNIEKKFEIISFLSNIFNIFSKKIKSDLNVTSNPNLNFNNLSNVKDLIKFLRENKNLPKMPIDKETFKELLTLLDSAGDIETFSKKYNKKFDVLCEEIHKIYNIFCKFFPRFINLRHHVKIDFSLMPTNLVSYAGIFLQVNYVDPLDKEKTVICEGGRIDNHLNVENESKPLKFRGFTLRYFTENIFKIKIQKMKENEYSNFNLDVVIIHTVEVEKEGGEFKKTLYDYIDDLKKKCRENKLSSELIYKQQISTAEFNEFFLAYRMKLLIIVKLDDLNKNVKLILTFRLLWNISIVIKRKL